MLSAIGIPEPDGVQRVAASTSGPSRAIDRELRSIGTVPWNVLLSGQQQLLDSNHSDVHGTQETASGRASAMSFGEFLDKHTDSEAGVRFELYGHECRELVRWMRDEDRARSLIATNFWRSLVSSIAWQSVLFKLDVTHIDVRYVDMVIVPRPYIERFDLLVLDPMYDGSPRQARVTANADQLVDGWYSWMQEVPPGSPIRRRLTASMATEVLSSGQPFSVVLAQAPRCAPLSAPDPPLLVDDQAGSKATAGLVVQEKGIPNQHYVTTALHALPNLQQGTQVLVASQQGSVIRSDLMSDSALISISQIPNQVRKPKRGIMSNMLPRGNETCDFLGYTSYSSWGQAKTTTVTGWDLDAPIVKPYRQLRIYTTPDGDPGDSGAALFTSDGYVVGFLLDRHNPGQQPERCAWVWADQVLTALNVEI